jgi:putative transposase
MKEQRVEQLKIHYGSDAYGILNEACFKSRLLYNKANYYQRQVFFGSGRDFNAILNPWKLRALFKDKDEYKALGGHLAAETVMLVSRAWKGWKESWLSWNKEYIAQIAAQGVKYKQTESGAVKLNFKGDPVIDKSTKSFKGEPKPPNYIKDNGLAPVMIDCVGVSQKEGVVKFPKRLGCIEIKTDKQVQSIRILPRYRCFIVELIYNINVPSAMEDNRRYFSIDLGVSNFVTMTSNIPGFVPVIVNGKGLKSVNRYYNKEKARYQGIAKQMNDKHTTRRIERLTQRRNNQIKDQMHKASRLVIDLAVMNDINIIVVGNNKGWKYGVNIGKRNNQNFTQLPFKTFIEQLKYKARQAGIRAVCVNESYTSKTSFLDGEAPCKHEKYAGKRVHRGLFKSLSGKTINADVNGSYQILKMYSPNVYTASDSGWTLQPKVVNVVKYQIA